MNTINLKNQLIRYRKQVLVGGVVVTIIIFGLLAFGGNSAEIIQPKLSGSSSAFANASNVNQNGEIQEYDYTEAGGHIGEKAIVKGNVVKVFTARSGVTFLDFCEEFSNCPFSAVIFASDLKKFEDVSKYQREVKITGVIKLYNGKAEIVINNPEQVE